MKLTKITEYGMILFAGVLYAIAIKYFVLPSKVILTGTEGIASSLSYYFENYNLFIILYSIFQLALIIFAFFNVGKTFAINSLIIIISVVILLAILPELVFAQPESQNERIILVIFGGLLAGTAKTLAFKNRGSTGDEDIIGAFFSMKYLKPVGAISVISGTVSTLFGLSLEIIKYGAIENAVNTLMYTCIYIFVSTEVLNNQYKKFQTTLLSIITTDYNKIGDIVSKTFKHRTYTVQPSNGGHSGNSFWLVKVIITREELPTLLSAINEEFVDVFYYYQDLEGISKKYFISPIGK